MKKIIVVFILLFLAFFIFPIANTVSTVDVNKNFLFEGVAVDNIDLSAFFAKYRNIPVSAYFVSDPKSLIDLANFAHNHNVRTFVKLDLFLYPFEADKPASTNDLAKYYNMNDVLSTVDKQKILSVISSLYTVGGKPVTEVQRSEPEIVITYKYESTKSGYIEIPIRTPKIKNTLTTYFLIDPLKFPYKDLTSYYQFVKAYTLNETELSIKIAKNKYQNKYLGFDGFYIPLPNVIDSGYGKVVEHSIERLRSDIGNKLIVLTNVTETNVEQVKNLGDIFVVEVSESNLDKIKSLRERLQDRLIIAKFDGNLSRENIEKFLDVCELYGIVPQFGRDLKTNEFFYYEDNFLGYSSEILNSLKIISNITNLKFINMRKIDNYVVSEFGDNNIRAFVFKGNGKVVQEIPQVSKNNINFIGDVFDVSLFTKNNKTYISFSINGTAFLETFLDNLINFGLFSKPSSSSALSAVLVNGTNEEISKTVYYDNSGNERSVSVEFKPFESKELVLETNEIAKLDGINLTNIPKRGSNMPEIVFVLLVLFIAFFMFRKDFRVKPILNKFLFLTISIALTLVLALVNFYYIGYNFTALTYLNIGLILLIYFLYRGYSRLVSFAFVYLGLFGIYNLIEFGTLSPHSQVIFPPYPTFEIIIFYFAILFSLVILLTLKRKIGRIELAFILILFTILLFFKGLPFIIVERVDLFSYLPFILIATAMYVSVVFDSELKSKIFETLLFLLAILIIFVSVYLNKLAIGKLLNLNTSLYPFSLLFIILLPVIFGIILEKERTNLDYKLDLNTFAIVFSVLFAISALFSAIGTLATGNPLYVYLGYLIQFFPLILFFILIVETIR